MQPLNLQTIQQPKYWLLGIGATLITLHLTHLNALNDSDLFGISALFWMAIGLLIWEKRQNLVLESDLLSTGLGGVLMGIVLLRSLSPEGYQVNLLPLVSGVGLALLASGWQRLPHYWKELAILGMLVVTPLVRAVLEAIELPALTAKFAAFGLWYLGQDVVRQGLFIILPTGTVEVYEACSGVSSIILMLNVAVLFLLLVPLRWFQAGFCVIAAVVIGFMVNAGRVALMAILVASAKPASFEYWHSGNGSLIFAVISVVLFGGLCWILFLRQTAASTTLEG